MLIMETQIFGKPTPVINVSNMYTPEFFKRKIQSNLPDQVYDILSIQARTRDEKEKELLISQIWEEQKLYSDTLLSEMMDRQEHPENYRSEEMNQKGE
jgi:hypothetical protein